jgi:hypothetical protein
MLAEASMQQFSDILIHNVVPSTSPCSSTTQLQSNASIVVGVLFVPVADVAAASQASLTKHNGWIGGTRFNFDSSPEDDSACCVGGLFVDMGGLMMEKKLSSSSDKAAQFRVVSSDWRRAEGGRAVAPSDIIHISYSPSAATASCDVGGWGGGRVVVAVDGAAGCYSCAADIPFGHVAGGSFPGHAVCHL